MIVHVEVTQEDIDKGQRRTCNICPVALALYRTVPACSPWVQTTTASIQGWQGPRAHLPLVARKFIEEFDHAQPVEPFAFDLEFPS